MRPNRSPSAADGKWTRLRRSGQRWRDGRVYRRQLTALSVYLALEQIPIRVMPTDPLSLRRASEGQALFGSLGCISCHVRELPFDSPVHVEVPDLMPGPSYRVDLT